MVTIAKRPSREKPPRLRWVHGAPGREMFDRQARKRLGISGEEFLRRWEAGVYNDLADDPDHPEIRRLVMLTPFAR